MLVGFRFQANIVFSPLCYETLLSRWLTDAFHLILRKQWCVHASDHVRVVGATISFYLTLHKHVSSVLRVSTVFASSDNSEDHLIPRLRLSWSTLSWHLAWTIITSCSQLLRSPSPTNCNVSWMQQHGSSVARGSTIVSCLLTLINGELQHHQSLRIVELKTQLLLKNWNASAHSLRRVH